MKYALHFGLNKYDSNAYGGDISLSGCISDAVKMRELSGHCGFNATVKYDHLAKRGDYIDSIRGLSNTAKRGDVVMITVSSHGTYFDKGMKRQTGICAFDGILWDWEIRELLKKFKAGVTLIWITDTCFSESNWRMIRPDGEIGYKHATARFARLQKNVLAKQSRIEPTQGDKRNFRATTFIYSSSTIYQPSYENESGGVFTSALDLAIQESKKYGESLSWYQIWRRVGLIISNWGYQQTPVFETVKGEKHTGKPIFESVI